MIIRWDEYIFENFSSFLFSSLSHFFFAGERVLCAMECLIVFNDVGSWMWWLFCINVVTWLMKMKKERKKDIVGKSTKLVNVKFLQNLIVPSWIRWKFFAINLISFQGAWFGLDEEVKSYWTTDRCHLRSEWIHFQPFKYRRKAESSELYPKSSKEVQATLHGTPLCIMFIFDFLSGRMNSPNLLSALDLNIPWCWTWGSEFLRISFHRTNYGVHQCLPQCAILMRSLVYSISFETVVSLWIAWSWLCTQ
jgi:hypothetical protein